MRPRTFLDAAWPGESFQPRAVTQHALTDMPEIAAMPVQELAELPLQDYTRELLSVKDIETDTRWYGLVMPTANGAVFAICLVITP